MDLEKFPDCETAKRMMGMVTRGFYDRSYIGKWLYQVMGMEMEEAKEFVESLIWQVFVETEDGLAGLLAETREEHAETATWGLRYHEEKYGFPARADPDYKGRGKLIYKKRNGRLPMTPYRMEIILSDLTGREIHIDDSGAVNQFEVQISSGSTDYSTLGVIETLMAIKQSHVVFSISENIVAKACCGCMMQESEILNIRQV